MERYPLKFLLLTITASLFCTGCSVASVVPNFPDHKHRIWLNTMQQAFSELRKEHFRQARELYANSLAMVSATQGATAERAHASMGIALTAFCAGQYSRAMPDLETTLREIEQNDLSGSAGADLRQLKVQCLQTLLIAQAETGAGREIERRTYERACAAAATIDDRKQDLQNSITAYYVLALSQNKREQDARDIEVIYKKTQEREQTPAESARQKQQLASAEKARSLCDSGEQKLAAGKPSESLHDFSESIKFSQGSKQAYSDVELRARLGQANANTAMGQPQKALTLHRETLNWLTQLSPRHSLEIATVLRAKGSIYLSLNKLPQAAECMQEAVKESRNGLSANSADKNLLSALALNVFFLASVQREAHDYRESDRNFKEAIKIRTEVPVQDYSSLADMRFQYGRMKVMENKPTEAVTQFELAIAQHQPDPNRGEQVSLITYTLANVLYGMKRTNQAKKLFKEVVENCAKGKWVDRDNVAALSKTQLQSIEKDNLVSRTNIRKESR